MSEFAFSLQATLDRATHEQRRAELDLAESRAAARAAAERLVDFDAPLQAVVQQIRRAGDEYDRAAAPDLSQAQRYWQHWQQERRRLLAERRTADLEARFTRHRVRLRQTELGWALSKVQAYQRLRQQELAAFGVAVRRREDRTQEDLANIRATRQAQRGEQC